MDGLFVDLIFELFLFCFQSIDRSENHMGSIIITNQQQQQQVYSEQHHSFMHDCNNITVTIKFTPAYSY